MLMARHDDDDEHEEILNRNTFPFLLVSEFSSSHTQTIAEFSDDTQT